MTLATFRCLTCEHTWEQKPGQATCPKCGAIYVKWLNYDAKAKIGDLLRRAKTWLPTTAIVTRTGLPNNHTHVTLRALVVEGAVIRRDDPLNTRHAEWRAAAE